MKDLESNIKILKQLTERLQLEPKNENLAASVKMYINKVGVKYTECGCQPKKILVKAQDVLHQLQS